MTWHGAFLISKGYCLISFLNSIYPITRGLDELKDTNIRQKKKIDQLKDANLRQDEKIDSQNIQIVGIIKFLRSKGFNNTFGSGGSAHILVRRYLG